MTTIGSPVYAGNSNYPLWLANGRPITSPTIVVDNLTKAFTTDVNESNTTTSYNDYPATTQAYAGVVYSKNGGIGSNSALLLQTNGQTNFAVNGGGKAVQSFRPLQVTNAESNFLQITPEAISFNGLASNALTISDGGGFEIGQTVEVLPGVLAVYNGTSNTETNLTPTALTIGTYANTTSNLLQDFSGQSLTGPSYTAQRPVFGGITWTTSGGGVADAGITKVNPALSSKGVTTNGVYPGANAQAAYFGNYLVSAPQPVGTYNGLILPTLVAQPGELITLSYSYAGGQSGAVIVNGIQIQAIPASAVWVNASTSFYATGNDEVEFQTQVIPYTGNNSQFNLTNINFNYTVASVSVPQVSVNSPSRNFANYGILNLQSLSTDGTTLGSYIQVGDGFNGILNASPQGSVLQINSNINLDSYGSVNITAETGTINLLANLNVYGNTISNASTIIATTAVSTPALDNPTSTLTIGSSSSSVTLTRASNVYTAALDGAFSGALTIGAATTVYQSNVVALAGVSGGAVFSNIRIMNNNAACPPASLTYSANLSGLKPFSIPILPKANIVTPRNSTIFGSVYTGDSYVASIGFTVPAYTVFSYSNIGSGTTTTYSNAGTGPLFYADTGFSPSSSSQVYALYPIIA
jgi:hypothetical protein